MENIIDLTKGRERIFEGAFAGDGRRGPRKQRQAAEGGGKIEEMLSIAEAGSRAIGWTLPSTEGTCPFISSTGVRAR